MAREWLRHAKFHDFVLYQLHVGIFFTPNLPQKASTFLDVARKIPHLAELGITAIQLMPIQEFQTQFSLGYNGTDYFSPEMDFAVEDGDLPPYVGEVNKLLDAKGLTPMMTSGHLVFALVTTVWILWPLTRIDPPLLTRIDPLKRC